MRGEADVRGIGILHRNDLGSSIQLLSQDFIGVHESLELSGEVVVLSKEHARVSLHGILLSKKMVHIVSQTAIGGSHSFDISLNSVQVFILIFDLDVV